MKAMIFAAGLGTRLQPITLTKPKALVEVAGKPLLLRTIEHLKKYGFNDVIINVHHLADQIENYVGDLDLGINIQISDERDKLLDTGGGLKKASWFFDDKKPFLVINSDVISNLDLTQLMNYHQKKNSLATLVVRDRNSSRQLLFNSDLRLCGWENVTTGEKRLISKNESFVGYPFSGIHALNPEIFDLITEEGKFSILDIYLKLSVAENIFGFVDSDSIWYDVGDQEKLNRAEKALKN